MALRGPFQIEKVTVEIAGSCAGSYVLSRDGRTAHYVGRSDYDVGSRIVRSAQEGYGYRWFWFQYASSPRDAFNQECELYHEYSPCDNDCHPAVPSGQYVTCPAGKCQWS